MNLAEIDKNFAVKPTVDREGLIFLDAEQEPFKIYGLMRENGHFCRLPKAVAEKTNMQVNILHDNTTGGRVRFRTDSPYVAVKVLLHNVTKASHFSKSGIAACDLYADNTYIGTFVPSSKSDEVYEVVIDLPNKRMQEILIHFPTYAGVNKLYIGLKEDCSIEKASDYCTKKPIVYYGSSITQGGCVSRPGNTYQNIISRELNVDQINLGFSSGAMAEESMIEHIIGLDMAAFVYDYDHNAPSREHLRNTHEKMFKKIRSAHPDLPILMLSAPAVWLDERWLERQNIVRKTYENAIAAGDKKVWFIPGTELFPPLVRECATVDNCHPNDAGFAGMASVIGEKLKEMLNL